MIISLVTLQAHAASQSPGGARRIPQPLIDRCLRGGRLPCRRRFRLQVGFGDLKPSLRTAKKGTVLATKDSGNTKQRHCRDHQIQFEHKAKTRPNTVEAQCKGSASATKTKVEARRKGTVDSGNSKDKGTGSPQSAARPSPTARPRPAAQAACGGKCGEEVVDAVERTGSGKDSGWAVARAAEIHRQRSRSCAFDCLPSVISVATLAFALRSRSASPAARPKRYLNIGNGGTYDR